MFLFSSFLVSKVSCTFLDFVLLIPFNNVFAASWFKRDAMTIYNEAIETGGEPQLSDAFTMNGQPGDLYPCSNGMSLE